MKVAINYADSDYRNAQRYNTKTAYAKGKFDKVIEYSPNEIDSDFKDAFSDILIQKRGGGYWLWKPYIINKTLKELNNGDYLFYADSGSYYIDSIDKLINIAEKRGDDIVAFSLPLIERQWTKRDIFVEMGCENNKEITDTNQRMATFILVKKTERSDNFFDLYLKYATQNYLITDKPSINGEDKIFIENRHDQSIFSVLSKLNNIPSYRDPSVYGLRPELLAHVNSNAIFSIDEKAIITPYIMVLHRKKKVNLDVKIWAFIRKNVPIKTYWKLVGIKSNIYKLVKRS